MSKAENGGIKGWVAFFLLCAAAYAVYSNTFGVSFRFDGVPAIVENPVIRDLGRAILKERDLRRIPYITFALNYQWTGWAVWSWHLVNLLFHCGAGTLVYGIARILARTPAGEAVSGKDGGRSYAFFAAAIFLFHPIQTSAVTYIYQRITVMAVFFYLGVIFCFVWWRFKGGVLPAVLCALSAAACCFSKSIVATLPITVILTEFFFFARREKGFVKSALIVLPLWLVPGLLFFLMTRGGFKGFSLETLRNLYPTMTNSGLTYGEWMLTQLNVMRTYLRLLIFPAWQRLDYLYPITKSILEPRTLFSIGLLIAVAAAGVRAFGRNRILSFGIFWLAATLCIEFVVIRDTIFEHRLYLPLTGFALAVPAFFYKLNVREAARTGILSAIVVALAFTAFARNAVWADEIRFWEDNARLEPHNPRPCLSLAALHTAKKQNKQAIRYFLRAVELHPDYAPAYDGLGTLYSESGEYGKAEAAYNEAIRADPKHAGGFYNLAILYWRNGKQKEALPLLHKTVEVEAGHFMAFNQLGIAYAGEDPEKSVVFFEKALEANPYFEKAKSNLGAMYVQLGRHRDAVKIYLSILEGNPGYAKALNNLGTAYWRSGEADKAEEVYRKAIQLDLLYRDAYLNLANFYLEKQRPNEAKKVLKLAIKQMPDFRQATSLLTYITNNMIGIDGNSEFSDEYDSLSQVK